ncbi:MAG TPA: pyruvate ferredoxin oxidoreductase [Ruminiclostridium sp.]|nr:pyruvate ferredoxin oxidoreductase [Ruminiclostridium sp.]
MNCILTGVGGQGTILASKLIAGAAMEKGLQVRTAETIGMAQRGGSVVSHVRLGEEIHSPLIPAHTADVIIGFEPAEAVRTLPYLKKDGMVIVSNKAIKPVTASLSDSDYSGEEMLGYLKERVSRLEIVDTDKICKLCGSAKVINVALLGVAATSGILGISLEEMESIIRNTLPEKYIKLNLHALIEGAKVILPF